jgi:hypothetical protein
MDNLDFEAPEKGMTVTIYHRPDGHAAEHFIRNVNDDDAQWFVANGVKVSLEDCGAFFAAYADCGLLEDDKETPRDIVVIGSHGDRFNALLAKLRISAQKAMEPKP